MKSRTPLATLTIACFLTVTVLGAAAGANEENALARTLSGLGSGFFDNVVEAAESMPESEYGFRPAPKARSFAELVAHVADANRTLCSSVAGAGIPVEPRTEKAARRGSLDKAEILDELRSSFSSCKDAFASLDDARMVALVELGGGARIDGKAVPQGKMPLGAVLAVFSAHTNLHYGNMATYLRMKDIVPPTSRDISP